MRRDVSSPRLRSIILRPWRANLPTSRRSGPIPALGSCTISGQPWWMILCKVNGITFALEEELHRHGVFRDKQIGCWTDANVAAFAEATGLRKEEIETGKWIPQARWHHLRAYGQATRWADPKPSRDRFEEMLGELFSGESVRVDDKFGFVYTGRPRYRDDPQPDPWAQ